MNEKTEEFLNELDEIVALVFDEGIDLEDFTVRYEAAKMKLRNLTNRVNSLDVINRADNTMPPGLLMRVPELSFTHFELKLENEGKKAKILLT